MVAIADCGKYLPDPVEGEHVYFPLVFLKSLSLIGSVHQPRFLLQSANVDPDAGAEVTQRHHHEKEFGEAVDGLEPVFGVVSKTRSAHAV